MEHTELIAGCIDSFCHGGYDVILQQQFSPVPENRKYHRKRWHIYSYGKFTGLHYKTDKEATAVIDRMNATKDFFFLREEDRKEMTDSLLLDSGQVVLSGKIGTYEACVVVCGEVRIIWKDEVYKTPSKFPDDLQDAIRKGALDQNEDAYIGNNNWYETRLYKDGALLEEDIIDLDLSTMTEEEGKTLLIDMVSDYLADNPN